MHFQMKIQPIDNLESTVKPVAKSRFKRLFDRQFPSVLKHNSEKINVSGEVKDVEFEPSSVCLAKMVQNFIEDTPEKPKCGRNRCNCFNGSVNDVSDDEFDHSAAGFFGDSSESLKILTACASVIQRNLLADASKIVENHKNSNRKDELIKTVAEQLQLLNHNASICKSHWEKSPSYPAGEYEYVDVITETGDRVLIDVDFRSEFEIARPTGNYKAIFHSLPYIFVGDADRLQQILSIVTEAARLSLKKRGMHVPPWRKYEYMRSKWLSSHVRMTSSSLSPPSVFPPTPPPTPDASSASNRTFDGAAVERKQTSECEVFELIIEEETAVVESLERKSDDGFEPPVVGKWEPPAVKPRSKLVVTGLASLFREKA